jgi:hypothetical protein
MSRAGGGLVVLQWLNAILTCAVLCIALLCAAWGSVQEGCFPSCAGVVVPCHVVPAVSRLAMRCLLCHALPCAACFAGGLCGGPGWRGAPA